MNEESLETRNESTWIDLQLWSAPGPAFAKQFQPNAAAMAWWFAWKRSMKHTGHLICWKMLELQLERNNLIETPSCHAKIQAQSAVIVPAYMSLYILSERSSFAAWGQTCLFYAVTGILARQWCRWIPLISHGESWIDWYILYNQNLIILLLPLPLLLSQTTAHGCLHLPYI